MPVADLNGDKRPDFVALVAQQYEHVVAFLNRGPGRGFRQETIFRAITPVWGSSGIQLVDLDKDGDLDVLMTNGDTLDDFTIRPFHGVRWLENKGEFPFVQHDLVAMPGVHRAQAVDIDGDGDLDVFACAFLPSSQNPQFQNLERQGNLSDLTSVGWLEQTSPGSSARTRSRRAVSPTSPSTSPTTTATATSTSSSATSPASRSRRRTPATRPSRGSSCGRTSEEPARGPPERAWAGDRPTAGPRTPSVPTSSFRG